MLRRAFITELRNPVKTAKLLVIDFLKIKTARKF